MVARQRRENEKHCCTMVALTFIVAFLCIFIFGTMAMGIFYKRKTWLMSVREHAFVTLTHESLIGFIWTAQRLRLAGTVMRILPPGFLSNFSKLRIYPW
jgi:hypothetical protein